MEKLNTFENKQERTKTDTVQIHLLKLYTFQNVTLVRAVALASELFLGACGNAPGATFMLALPTSDHSSERCKVPI